MADEQRPFGFRSAIWHHAQPFIFLIFFEQGLTNLIILSLDGNPLAEQLDSYRTYVVFHLPTLKALDGIAVVRTCAGTRFQALLTLRRWESLGFCFCHLSFLGGEWVWKCKRYVWGEIKPRHGCREAGPHRLRWRQLPHPGVLLYSVIGSQCRQIPRMNEWKVTLIGGDCFPYLGL